MITTFRYVHGSEDSTDLDVHYVVDALPSFTECKTFCSQDPLENRNLVVINDGIVTDCYKGTPDEINNGLLVTYFLHEQEHPLLVNRVVPRDVLIKCVRAVRCVLSHYSRTSQRTLVKTALRSESWDVKLEALSQIDYQGIYDFKKDNRENVFKIFSFQIGQTLGLLNNTELFTKSQISNEFPLLKPYLQREVHADPQALISMIHLFIEKLRHLEHIEKNHVVHFPAFNKTINLVNESYI